MLNDESPDAGLSNSKEIDLTQQLQDDAIGAAAASRAKGELKPSKAGIFSGDIELHSEFLMKKSEIQEQQNNYLAKHPELKTMLADYLQFLLQEKPEDVYQFTMDHFGK